MITNGSYKTTRRFTLVITLVLLISTFFGCAKMEEYAAFNSPDGKYKIVVMKKSTFFGKSPGQGGDVPGEVRLVNKNGDVLQQKDVEMVQLVEKVEWTEKNVYIKLVADWELPE